MKVVHYPKIDPAAKAIKALCSPVVGLTGETDPWTLRKTDVTCPQCKALIRFAEGHPTESARMTSTRSDPLPCLEKRHIQRAGTRTSSDKVISSTVRSEHRN
jgi:hypothetical protein